MLKMNMRLTKAALIPCLILVVAAFVAGILFATAGGNLTGKGESFATESVAASIATPLAASRTDLEQTFIDVAEAVNPAVVQIRTRAGVVEGGANPLRGTPFEQFFDMPDPQQRDGGMGIGSGLVIGEDGYILTNHHVVANAKDIDITLLDGRVLQAKLVGSDDFFDIAVLKVEAEGLRTIPFGTDEDIRVGQWVMAFGSPLSSSLNNTVTAGIVSGLGRVSDLNRGSMLIQTDAVINRGNSGGPLVDLRGRLIGINTLIASPTAYYAGIGFAVPVSTVVNAVEQLTNTGTVERGFLGVTFDRVPQTLVEAMDIPPGSAQVTDVWQGAAAERAGVRAGDIITGVDGKQLDDYQHLLARISANQPGDIVVLDLVRDDAALQFEVRLGEIPEELASNRPPMRDVQDEGSTGFQELGLTLTDFDLEEMRERFEASDAPSFEGVLITQVDPGSDAAQDALLRRLDVITEANGVSIASVGDLKRVYDRAQEGDTIKLTVKRYTVQSGFLMFRTALRKPE